MNCLSSQADYLEMRNSLNSFRTPNSSSGYALMFLREACCNIWQGHSLIWPVELLSLFSRSRVRTADRDGMGIKSGDL